MEDKQEKPMFEFNDSQVNKLNDNFIESGTMVKDKGSVFLEVQRNRRGQSKESIKSKLKWEIVKSPVTILIGIIILVIAAILGL